VTLDAPSLRADLLLIALMLALYTPLIFFGYGSDEDTYLVLDSGRALIDHHTYRPSRNPGYFLFESMNAVLARVGGSVLCNAATLAAGIAAVLCFVGVCRELEVPRRHLLGVLFVLHPVAWVAATSTMDYTWALALLLAGLLCVIRRAYVAAGFILGLAIAMRSTSFVAAGLVLTFALVARREDWRKIMLAGTIAAVLGGLFYVPSWRHAGCTLSFLKPMIGEADFWTPKLRLARFLYKNVYFWGLLGSMMLPVLLALGRRGISDRRHRPTVLACAAVVVAYEALFLKYPLEGGYLLPMLPAVLILLGIGLAHRPAILAAFGAALALYAVVSINVARPDEPYRATGGRVGLWIEHGPLWRDVRMRTTLLGCDTHAGWQKITGINVAPRSIPGDVSGRNRE
jgi:hypothetical protein